MVATSHRTGTAGRRRGTSLVELLVVLAIIAVLLSLLLCLAALAAWPWSYRRGWESAGWHIDRADPGTLAERSVTAECGEGGLALLVATSSDTGARPERPGFNRSSDADPEPEYPFLPGVDTSASGLGITG